MHRRSPTPLVTIPPFGNWGKILVKDESTNPTGTFKDLLASQVAQIAGRGSTVVAFTYGNTALSLIAASASPEWRGLGLSLALFMPETIQNQMLGPSSSGRLLDGASLIARISANARVILVPHDSPYLDDASMAKQLGLDVEGVVNVSEGLGKPSYTAVIEEAVAELGYAPSICLVPYGAGILCNDIQTFLAGERTIVVPLAAMRPDTMAAMLYGPMWLQSQTGADGLPLSVHRMAGALSHYPVHPVTEQEICVGLLRARQWHLSCEPSAAVGLGVLDRLASLAPSVEPTSATVLVINTGNGIDRFLDAGAPDQPMAEGIA